jgi:hypothetical protein
VFLFVFGGPSDSHQGQGAWGGTKKMTYGAAHTFAAALKVKEKGVVCCVVCFRVYCFARFSTSGVENHDFFTNISIGSPQNQK